jgi:molybdopterin/thiamine biosynthesis adenylyltransferase
MELSISEKERYARQLVLSTIGLKGQQNLKNSTIYVVGAGGLGSTLLPYLAAAGIGKIRIIDGDVVQLNNLQRQVLFTQNEIGINKAIAAKNKLSALNQHTDVSSTPHFITEENMNNFLTPNSIIADCSDNFKTRYLINDYAVANNCTLVSASVYKNQLQFGVFNFPYQDNKRSATFRCAFPEQNIEDIQDTCAQTGVLGLVPGIGGLLMANEIIKIVTLSNQVQYNKLHILDLQNLSLKQWAIKRNKDI